MKQEDPQAAAGLPALQGGEEAKAVPPSAGPQGSRARPRASRRGPRAPVPPRPRRAGRQAAGPPREATAAQITGLIAANASMLLAALLYAGFWYEAGYLGAFGLSPGQLGYSTLEYVMTTSLAFTGKVIFIVALLAAVSAGRRWLPGAAALARSACLALGARAARGQPRRPRAPLRAPRRPVTRRAVSGAGAAATAAALLLLRGGGDPGSRYLATLLLGAGLLLLTAPYQHERHGAFPHALAIVTAVACALLAVGIYAYDTGFGAASSTAGDASVDLYSMQDLSLSGPGVTVRRLSPGSLYRYEYQGLYLLNMRSGTYYLFPRGWSGRRALTYILPGSDQIRVVLDTSS